MTNFSPNESFFADKKLENKKYYELNQTKILPNENYIAKKIKKPFWKKDEMIIRQAKDLNVMFLK